MGTGAEAVTLTAAPSGDTRERFAALYRSAVTRSDARVNLDTLIRSLDQDQALDCLATSLLLNAEAPPRDAATKQWSLRVFAALAKVVFERGAALDALRLHSLVQARGTLWRESYVALSGEQRKKLEGQATRKLRALSAVQHTFLGHLSKAVERGESGPLQQYVDGLDLEGVHDCLLTYLAASLRYAPADPQAVARSLQVFAGVSFTAIRKGGADYARRYRALVGDEGTTASIRWASLSRDVREGPEGLEEQLRKADRRVEPPSPPPPSAKQPRSPAYAQFIARFEKTMAARGTLEARYKELADFIMAQPYPAARDVLAAYLEVSQRYPASDPLSLRVFFGAASWLIHRPGAGAYEAMKLDFLVKRPGTLEAQRLAALPDGKDGMGTTLRGELAARLKQPRLLDALKFEHWKERGTDADPGALRRYEPEGSGELREQVRGLVLACDRTFGLADVKAFTDAFDAWTELCGGLENHLRRILALKYCRETGGVAGKLRSELYWHGVLAALIHARFTWGEGYRSGFDAEEEKFLLDVDQTWIPVGLRPDFEQRLEYVVRSHPLQPTLAKLSRAHAYLVYVAERRGLSLVTMERAAAIRDELEKLKAKDARSLDVIRIPVSGSDAAEITLGQTIGDLYVIWFDPRGRAYVEINGYERILFEVETFLQLGKLAREDATYGRIWRDNQHLLQVIPFFFQVLGYLPDLVTGGFAGLVESVVTDIVVDLIAEKANLSPKAAMALSFLANAASGHITDRMRATDGKLTDADVLVATEYLASVASRSTEFDSAIRDELARLAQKGTGGTGTHQTPVAPPERLKGPDSQSLVSGGAATPTAPDAPSPSRVHAGEADDAKARGRLDDRDDPGFGKETVSAREEGGKQGGKKGGGKKGEKKVTDPRATEGRMLDEPDDPGTWRQNLITDENDPALADLKAAGWTFTPRKAPSKGAAWMKGQQWRAGELEWDITSPKGITLRADGLERSGDGLGIIEVKISMVEDPNVTPHSKYWAEKADPLARAALLRMESGDVISVDLSSNLLAQPRPPGSPVGTPKQYTPSAAGDVYASLLHQQVAEELLTNYKPQLRERLGRIPTRDELTELIERGFDMSSFQFGSLPKKTPPKGKQPPGPKGPPKKPPRKPPT